MLAPHVTPVLKFGWGRHQVVLQPDPRKQHLVCDTCIRCSHICALSLVLAQLRSRKKASRASHLLRVHCPSTCALSPALVRLQSRKEASCAAHAPETWHSYAVKEDWYAEYDSVAEFGPVAGIAEGELPEELRGGTFYRNGPANFSRGKERYSHIIDGDGMILQINFPRSSSEHDFVAQARFVRTDTFVEEERNDRICARSSFGTQRRGLWVWQNTFDAKIKNCANTHVLDWGGKLLALFETGLPYQLDPDSLETLREVTFEGSLRPGTAASLGIDAVDTALGFGDAVTAHPHIDLARERFIIWSNRVDVITNNIKFCVTEWDKTWKKQSQTSFAMAAGTAPHDFAVTDSFYIWAENRMSLGGLDLAKYLVGLAGPAEGVQADPLAPVRIHLVARRRAEDGSACEQEPLHLVVETDPWFSIHHSHAEELRDEDGSTLITLYSAGWDGEGLKGNDGRFLAAWKGYAPDFDVIPPTYYWRTRIKVTGQTATLLDHGVYPGMEATCIDHPHVHPAQECGPGADCAYMTYSNSDGLSSPSIGWMKLDLRTGEKQLWSTGHCEGKFCLEPVIVPKKEGAGVWLLGVLNDHREDKSSLCVLDGDDLEKGPVCRLALPTRLPHALHGSFSNDAA